MTPLILSKVRFDQWGHCASEDGPEEAAEAGGELKRPLGVGGLSPRFLGNP